MYHMRYIEMFFSLILTTYFSLLAGFCFPRVELILSQSIRKKKVSLKDVVEISDHIV